MPLPKSVKWFWVWVWRLRRERARLVLAGLRLADGSEAQDANVIFTSGVHFRDDIVRLALHAGYSARFNVVYKKGDHRGYDVAGQAIVARHDHWVVAYTDYPPAAEPVLHNHRDVGAVDVPSAAAPVPVWCPTVPPHHLIIARRVRKNAQGVVTQASRPIVVGNCWGKGVYIIQTKRERYEGDFDEGRMEGKGSYLFSNHDLFTGDYRNDKRDGRGTLQYHLNGTQQLQEDLEVTLSGDRRRQQAAEDVDPDQATAIDAAVRPVTLPTTYPTNKGEVLYSGDWSSDLPHGQGVFVTAALFYAGDFVSGERSGTGSIVMKGTGERYDGSVVNGVREGQGRMTSSWGHYSGAWKDNQRHGVGRWEYRRRAIPSHFPTLRTSPTLYLNVYQGSFVNDQASGQGQHAYWDGSHYEGGHHQLLPHGRGVMTYANRDQFVGDWVKGQRQGQGRVVYSTRPFQPIERVDRHGAVVPPTSDEAKEADATAALPRPIYVQYEGDWAQDQPHGKGGCLYPDGAVYTGQFSGGQATGQGRTVYENGDTYEGGHVAGIREGRGVYTWAASGNAYEGRWKQGVRYIPPDDPNTSPLTIPASDAQLLDDVARWKALRQHCYRNAATGEVYEGQSNYGRVGQWAKTFAQRGGRASAGSDTPPTVAAAGSSPPLPHPSTPDSPAFVRHGLGVLRAPQSNAVYSHWMGQWRDDLRDGLGRLFLLGSAPPAALRCAIGATWWMGRGPVTGRRIRGRCARRGGVREGIRSMGCCRRRSCPSRPLLQGGGRGVRREVWGWGGQQQRRSSTLRALASPPPSTSTTGRASPWRVWALPSTAPSPSSPLPTAPPSSTSTCPCRAPSPCPRRVWAPSASRWATCTMASCSQGRRRAGGSAPTYTRPRQVGGCGGRRRRR